MFRFAFGSLAARCLRVAVAPSLLVLLAASQGGCAETNAAYAANSADVAVNTSPYVEMEADGMPAQPPPRQRSGDTADDPSEPFSRNYGGPNPASVTTPVPSTASGTSNVPADAPPDLRRKLADASRADAN